MQSSLSRLIAFIDKSGILRPDYKEEFPREFWEIFQNWEENMAVGEGKSAIDKWTEIRKKMR